MASNLTQQFGLALDGEETSSSENDLAPGIIWTLVTLYFICCCVSLVGNTSIILLICVTRSLRNAQNYFLMCIAISDLIFLSCCVPLTVIANLIENHWTFGKVLCKVVGYVQTMSVVNRALVMTSSAAAQYYSFRLPFRDGIKTSNFGIILVLIWVISLLFPVPIALYSKLWAISPNGSGADDVADTTALCLEIWPDEGARRIFGVMLMVATYVVPLSVSVVTKGHIANITLSCPPGEHNATLLARRKSLKRKTLALFVMIVTSYAICWLPIHVINIIGDVNPNIFDNQYVQVLWLFAHLLAVSNSAINPLIVLLMQRKFSVKIKQAVGIGSASGKNRSSINSDSKCAVNGAGELQFNRHRRLTQQTWI